MPKVLGRERHGRVPRQCAVDLGLQNRHKVRRLKVHNEMIIQDLGKDIQMWLSGLEMGYQWVKIGDLR